VRRIVNTAYDDQSYVKYLANYGYITSLEDLNLIAVQQDQRHSQRKVVKNRFVQGQGKLKYLFKAWVHTSFYGFQHQEIYLIVREELSVLAE
jgi:hypothetical protein